MPEGDSIHILAHKLAPLVGKRVTSFAAHPIPDSIGRSLVGLTITSVRAKGKNLLITFEDGRVLHVHLRMWGRVRFERPRSAYWAPRKTPPQLRLEVEGLAQAVVGNQLPVLRLLEASQLPRDADLTGLGPDLIDPELDEAECVRRLRALGEREIGDALLQQRALAGIGNVYKSEVLFLEGVAPRRSVASLDDATLQRLVHRASILLRQNVRPGRRTTRTSLSGPRLWVYRRAERPCLRCERAAIRRILQGAAPGRSTYYCPSCQPETTP